MDLQKIDRDAPLDLVLSKQPVATGSDLAGDPSCFTRLQIRRRPSIEGLAMPKPFLRHAVRRNPRAPIYHAGPVSGTRRDNVIAFGCQVGG